jgi:ribosome-associated protein
MTALMACDRMIEYFRGMKIDIGPEMRFRFSRSGGKGGQHVNKVETRVEGLWNPAVSALLTDEQRERVLQRLADRLENRHEAVDRMNAWLEAALRRKKARIATSAPAAARRRRLEEKKRTSARKSDRRRPAAPGGDE